jgi:hypothetical protein
MRAQPDASETSSAGLIGLFRTTHPNTTGASEFPALTPLPSQGYMSAELRIGSNTEGRSPDVQREVEGKWRPNCGA